MWATFSNASAHMLDIFPARSMTGMRLVTPKMLATNGLALAAASSLVGGGLSELVKTMGSLEGRPHAANDRHATSRTDRG